MISTSLLTQLSTGVPVRIKQAVELIRGISEPQVRDWASVITVKWGRYVYDTSKNYNFKKNSQTQQQGRFVDVSKQGEKHLSSGDVWIIVVSACCYDHNINYCVCCSIIPSSAGELRLISTPRMSRRDLYRYPLHTLVTNIPQKN
jgi:hypothetical protein